MTLDPVFVYGNYVEACLWAAMGVLAFRRRRGRASIALATALLLFGVSDIVEVQTGAWYRPWWLLVWKAACVLCALIFGVMVIRRR